MIEINTNPTPKEIRVFGLLWLVFFCGLAGVAWWRPQGLIGAATILGTAWLASMVFNPFDRRVQIAGAALPALFAAIGFAARSGLDPLSVAVSVAAVGVAGSLPIWLSFALGRAIYLGWMYAALPIGWTISHVVLGLVYYLVLTPVGLGMRLLGHDPMNRRFDRQAPSYWVERDRRTDPKRAFRQF